ncbi:MAG: HDOD domain-containing protein [Chthoniobacteraceae bacterium]
MSAISIEPASTAPAGRRATAERLIARTEHISVSPPVAFQIFSLVRNGVFPSDALIDLVRLDPDLTAQLLRLCNSAELRGNGVSSLKEAALRLGNGVIAAKAMSLAVGRLVAVPLTAYCPDPNALWRHSVQTALAARYLAPHCEGGLNPETAFTAGLLHDLGKLVINAGAPDELNQIVAMRKEKHLPYADAELEVLGADHAEIGGLILERWNLPAQIVDGVRYHHAPDFDRSGMANLIHVAEACSKVTEDPESWGEFNRVVHPFVLDTLKLSQERVKECWEAVILDTRVLEAYLG